MPTSSNHFKKISIFFALFVIVATCIASDDKTNKESLRLPITPFVEAKAGAYFKFVSRIQKSGYGKHAVKFFDKKDVDRRHRSLIKKMNHDELAYWDLIAYEGYESVLLQMKFAHEAYGVPELPEDISDKITHRVVYPDNSIEVMPYGEALLFYYGMLTYLDRRLNAFKSEHELASTYTTKVHGDCPFEDGNLEFQNEGNYIEATRNGKLLIKGVMGASKGWFLVTEQRYGVVTTSSDGTSLKIIAPDMPSELYQADIENGSMSLKGRVFSKCSIVLKEAG
jgi:hypothetical protein